MTLGVDVPLAGPDGAQGILALQAVRLAVNENSGGYAVTLAVRDASGGGFADPHEDEGAGDWRNPSFASKNVAGLGRDRNIIGIIGGFNEAVAQAETRAANELDVPIIFASRIAMPTSDTRRTRFAQTYDRSYREAPSTLAERYYAATRMILDCGAYSREELRRCLRKRRAWNR